MLRKMTYRKITVTLCALITLFCFYFFPVKDNIEFKERITYIEEENIDEVYLVDKSDYVSLVAINIEENDKIEEIKQKLEYLIIDGKYSSMVPNGFKPIIPSEVVINNVELNESTIRIDFSNEIFDVNKNNIDKMIEAIIFTVTENSNILDVYLYSDGKLIEEIANKKLKYPLTRKIGINKKYDINKLDNIVKTTVFYLAEHNDEVYYVPVTHVTNNSTEKIMVIINELKSSVIYQSNLSSYLNSNAELEKYEIIEKTMYLDFNDKIFDLDQNKVLEEVKYTISESIYENYDVDEVVFRVDSKVIE